MPAGCGRSSTPAAIAAPSSSRARGTVAPSGVPTTAGSTRSTASCSTRRRCRRRRTSIAGTIRWSRSGWRRRRGSCSSTSTTTPSPCLPTSALRHTPAPRIFPTTYIAATIDTLWYLELHPHGPDRTTLVHGACFPRAVVERPDFDEVVKNYYRRWDITIEEDNAICELQQRGLASRINGRGRFCHRERAVHEIDNWVLD